MNRFVPSRYQQAFFDAVATPGGDIQLAACAGSGKSTTIEQAVCRLPYHIQRHTLITAFNRHIRAAMVERQHSGHLPAGVAIQTIHSLGMGALRRGLKPIAGDNWIDEYKTRNLVANLLTLPEPSPVTQGAVTELGSSVTKLPSFVLVTRDELERTGERLVRLLMLTLLPPTYGSILDLAAAHDIDLPDNPEQREALLETVLRALDATGSGLAERDERGLTYHPAERISFDDMIYLPVALGLAPTRYQMVFVDEAQDLSAAQQQLILSARAPGGRICWVGDSAQAIYGFAGADPESFDRIRYEHGATPMPLSICYRCPRRVVELAAAIGANAQIEPASDAPTGQLARTSFEDLLTLAADRWQLDCHGEQFLLVCRLNAPLITAAFILIRRGVPAHIEGRDIGAGLLRLIKEVCKGITPAPKLGSELIGACESYAAAKVMPLLSQEGKEQQAIALQDRLDCLIAIAQGLPETGTINTVERYINEMFADDMRGIRLSSIHKAKGLQAERVGILEPQQLPHPMARQPWQRTQELNLAYVAVTRAQRELYVAGAFNLDIPAARFPELYRSASSPSPASSQVPAAPVAAGQKGLSL